MRQVTPGFVMVEKTLPLTKLSKRAEQVLSLIPRPLLRRVEKGSTAGEFMLYQSTLSQQLGCSRWTIGRAIKRLKEAGLLVEIGRDQQTRCKTYALQAPSPLGGEGLGVRFPMEATPQGQVQLENYRHLFECNLGSWPDWEKHYASVTWELKDVHCIHKLFRQTFDRLYEIRNSNQKITSFSKSIASGVYIPHNQTATTSHG